MNDSASADLLYLLSGFIRPPGVDHPGWAQALGIVAPVTLEDWQAAYSETFLIQCVPHASIYLGRQGAIGGEAAARVSDFRHLLGSHHAGDVTTDVASDGLTELLDDYAALVAQSSVSAAAAHARKALLWEHLLCWLPLFLDSVEYNAEAPYVQWAQTTRKIFTLEAKHSHIPELLPLHLREAPAAIDAEITACNNTRDLISALLTPIRSGFILTRGDLLRIGKQLGISLRFSSRQQLLRDLLEARAQDCLRMIRQKATRQAATLQSQRATYGPIADFWSKRATQTERQLDRMLLPESTTL